MGWPCSALPPIPPSGTITPATATDVTWTGTGTGVPPSAGGEDACEEGANCDTFVLTLSGTPADWVGKQVKVRIQWLANTTDYDLYIHKGSLDGPVVASSGDAASTDEETALNPASSSIGTGEFYVRAVYFAAAAGDQYSGSASVIGRRCPAGSRAHAGTGMVAPRYQNHTPPAAGPGHPGSRRGRAVDRRELEQRDRHKRRPLDVYRAAPDVTDHF